MNALAKRQLRRRALAVLLLAAVPLVSYAILMSWLRTHGGAGVMLGAVSGSATMTLAMTTAALALRLYTVVLLPSVLTYMLLTALLVRKRRPNDIDDVNGR